MTENEIPGVLDRDQARAYLLGPEGVPGIEARPDVVEEWLDFLAGCVRPAAIDRDALRHELAVMFITERHDTFDDEVAADRIVALVRPVAGVVLTPEEAALALGAVHRDFNGEPSPQARARLGALAARLKASGA